MVCFAAQGTVTLPPPTPTGCWFVKFQFCYFQFLLKVPFFNSEDAFSINNMSNPAKRCQSRLQVAERDRLDAVVGSPVCVSLLDLSDSRVPEIWGGPSAAGLPEVVLAAWLPLVGDLLKRESWKQERGNWSKCKDVMLVFMHDCEVVAY